MTKQIETALNLLHANMAISLGGGRHMQSLATAIRHSQLTNIRICSPAEPTITYCEQIGLTVERSLVTTAIAFDGCDCVDANLNLLKSNGGIHTDEKRHALLADQFVILTSASRVHKELAPTVPLTIEAFASAAPLIQQITRRYNLRLTQRVATNYLGYTRTRAGHCLFDCFASNWQSIRLIAQQLECLPGVIATSYFHQLATTVLVETATGQVQVLRKEDSNEKI